MSTANAQTGQRTTAQQPVIITPPAVKDGSNLSRAPFPAARQFDDVKAPDGQAIDNLPPNTPATNSEKPVPPPVVAIFQPAQPAGVTSEPGLLPTGRPSVALATTIDSATVAPTIRAATLANREQVLADIETRMTSAEQATSSLRDSARQMSADARRTFNTASDEVKDKARALKKSLQSARNAKEQNWETVRTQLAADFDAYATALARLDTAAGVAPTGN